MVDLLHLSTIAIDAAHAAGEVIQGYLNEEIIVEEKIGGASLASQVVTEVDRACEAAILRHLLPTCKEFGVALLSEETADDGSRFEQDSFWCIDPMDGTLAFIHKYPGFSVSIALVAKDGTPLIGVVLDPSTNNVYHAIKGNGAFKNGRPWQVNSTNEYLTYVTDKALKDTPQSTVIEDLLQEKAKQLGLDQITEIAGAGSVLNAIIVLENAPACMLKLPKLDKGGGSTWDFAATACIYQELDLPATTYEVKKLDLNKRDGTFMNEEGVYFASFL